MSICSRVCALSRFALPLSLLLSTAHCSDVDMVVEPGGSIQAAIDAMPKERSSWVVQVRPGLYKESLDVNRPGVELRGVVSGSGGSEERAILDGTLDAGKLRKDAVVVSGAYFTISGFLVRNYSGNGITTQKTHHVTFRNVITDNAGKYGLYPVESEDILIENCVASRISDAGIYVGQSKRATVRGCKAYGNVAGIEIENTVDSVVEDNEAWDNAGGLLVFVLPNNPSKVGSHCVVRNNYVHDNNHENFGDPMSTVAKVPPGLGMLVMAADDTTITKNRFEGNGSVAIAVISIVNLVGTTSGLDIEPNSDTTKILDNTYKNNGLAPSPAFKAVLMDPTATKGGDLVFDGTGKGNCQDEPNIDNLRSLLIPLNRC
jgi:parallel beta-helix repeat protein